MTFWPYITSTQQSRDSYSGSLAKEPILLTTNNNSQYLHIMYNEPDILQNALHWLIEASWHTQEAGTITVFILYMRKLGHREVKAMCPGQAGSK